MCMPEKSHSSKRVWLASGKFRHGNFRSAVKSLHILIRNMDCKRHRAMPAAAEHITVTDKISGLLRGELRLRCSACTHLDRDIQVTNTKSVRHVCALEHQHHRLALL